MDGDECLTVVDEDGVRIVEGRPDETFMTTIRDVDPLIETGFSGRAQAVLLYQDNLTPGFFDLSSGEAGAVLQKLRQYGFRLAVVCPAEIERFSEPFRLMVAEERRGRHFAVFETRDAALKWFSTG